MANINLADTSTRWRWRRFGGLKDIDQMMEVPTAEMLPSGTFTNTLLQFTAQELEVPPECKEYFPLGIPDPAHGIWYKGIPEKADKYTDDWDVVPTVGTFWARLWEPTPIPPGEPPNQEALTILLFQYGFAVPKLVPLNNSGVRIFTGHLSKKPNHETTFFGRGIDNWVSGTGDYVTNTFTLSPVRWNVENNTNINDD